MLRFLQLFCLNAVFYPLLVLFSLLAVPTLTLFIAVQAPFVGHRRAMRLFRRCIRWYGYVVIYILPWPWVRVRYEEHSLECGGLTPLSGGPAGRAAGLDPVLTCGTQDGASSRAAEKRCQATALQKEGSGACIVICNHRSSSDPFLMGALPLEEAVQIVNTWPFHLPLWGPMAKWAGYLSVKAMPPEEFFTRGSELLKQGVSLIAFPEGTRARTLEVGPFHGTLFRLALETKVPIVPVCISGNERIPPRGTLWLRPGRVVLRQLPTLTWETYKDLTAFQLKNRVRDMIARELATMEGWA